MVSPRHSSYCGGTSSAVSSPCPDHPDPRRRVENLDAFGFALTVKETARIGRSLPHQRIGFDPETHEKF